MFNDEVLDTSDVAAVCPYCGHENNPGDDAYELYDENVTEWECKACGSEFSVQVYVSYLWVTKKLGEDGQ
jgi:transposase-like protein